MVVKASAIETKCDTKENEQNELDEKISLLSTKRQKLEWINISYDFFIFS